MALQPEDKARLIKYVDFLETEISDFPRFCQVSWKKYNQERDTRRNLERWIENVVSCSIDIAKVLLIAEGRNIPPTYKEVLRALGSLKHSDEKATAQVNSRRGRRFWRRLAERERVPNWALRAVKASAELRCQNAIYGRGFCLP